MAFEIPGISSFPSSCTRHPAPVVEKSSPLPENQASWPVECARIQGAGEEALLSRQQVMKAFQGVEETETTGQAHGEQPNLIGDLIRKNQHKLLPMEWKKPLKGAGPEPLPCNGRAVTAAFRKGEGVLSGKPGFFSPQVRMVEVREPASLGEAAELLVSLAGQERGLIRREYGLMFYTNERGEARFLVERGTGAIFTPDLHKYRVIETPDHQQWLLLGCIGHTHPFSGVGKPSEKDLSALNNSDTGLNQRFSIVAAQGGWHLFNSAGAYEPDAEAIDRPISGLMDI